MTILTRYVASPLSPSLLLSSSPSLLLFLPLFSFSLFLLFSAICYPPASPSLPFPSPPLLPPLPPPLPFLSPSPLLFVILLSLVLLPLILFPPPFVSSMRTQRTTYAGAMLREARKIWEKMKNIQNKKIGMTHDGLLKEVVCMPWYTCM